MGASSLYQEQQALTRSPSVPTQTSMATNVNDKPKVGQGNINPGDGLRITSLTAIVVSCYANANNTLSGGGSLLCWVWNADAALWCRAPDLDLSLGWGGSAVQQARIWPALINSSRLGARINFLTSGVTVSGGADVLVQIQGFAGSYGS